MLQADQTADQKSPPAVTSPWAGSRASDTPAAALLIAGVAVHALFLLSLKFGWLNPLFNDSMHRFGPGCDFFSIYAAGVKARAGESIYTIGGHVDAVPYAYAFRYAPLVAYTLGLGLSLLPALASYAVWLIACELALLRNVRLTLEIAPDRRTGYLAVSLWLLFSPYYLELYVGQFTFVTASLVFWAYLGWRGKSEDPAAARSPAPIWEADAFWGVAVWLKMMPLLFLPLVLLRGRWKTALAVLLVLGASSTVYFAHFPADWAVFADTNGDPRPAGHAGNHGLMALLYHLTGERLRPFLVARFSVILVTGLSLFWLTCRAWLARPWAGTATVRGMSEAEGGDRLLALYAACSAAYLLTYKDVWEHHYVLLLPPLVLLALRRRTPWLWVPPFLICALPGLFVLYDVPGLGYNEDPQVYWRPAVSLLEHGWKPLAPLWLLAGLLAQSVLKPQWEATLRKKRTALRYAFSILVCLGIAAGVGWARAAIIQQKQVAQVLVWPPQVFRNQEQPEACGPAALAAVCRHYGVPATENEMARLAGTTAQGTSMLGLERAARAKGLTAEGVRSSLPELPRVPRPCILFFQRGHFAVLTGVRGDLFYLADPSLGQHVWTGEQLAQFWHGELLIVGPAPGGRASAGAP